MARLKLSCDLMISSNFFSSHGRLDTYPVRLPGVVSIMDVWASSR
jgi:hypothetical protein